MRKLNIIITLVLLLFSFNLVSAKKGLFGKSSSIKEIQELEVQGPEGQDLYLAYRTTSQFFIAGLYLKDEGYVLGIRGKYGSYYPLKQEQIKQMQKVGQLPKLMPEYNIPWQEYAFGYSGWLIIPLLFWRVIIFFKKIDNNDVNERG